MLTRLPRLALFALFVALASIPGVSRADPVPVIAAAADLKYAMTELARDYRSATGREVNLVFGSSGSFTQQIENGAPFELFLSADEGYVDRLVANGWARDRGVVYAIGRIVLFVPHGSSLRADPTLADLRSAAADGRLKRFAIANPEVAPYGRAARDALRAAGLWELVQPALVLGENAGQATQFAASGNAQGGIVPSALTKTPEIAKLGTAASLPDTMYEPLRQRMTLMKRARPVATDFYRWLQTPAARAVFIRHGFALPGEG